LCHLNLEIPFLLYRKSFDHSVEDVCIVEHDAEGDEVGDEEEKKRCDIPHAKRDGLGFKGCHVKIIKILIICPLRVEFGCRREVLSMDRYHDEKHSIVEEVKTGDRPRHSDIDY